MPRYGYATMKRYANPSFVLVPQSSPMFATEIMPGRNTISVIPTSCYKPVPIKEEKAPEVVISRGFLPFPRYVLLSFMIVDTVRSPFGVRAPKKTVKYCFFTFCMIKAKHAKVWNMKMCMTCVHANEARGGCLCIHHGGWMVYGVRKGSASCNGSMSICRRHSSRAYG